MSEKSATTVSAVSVYTQMQAVQRELSVQGIAKGSFNKHGEFYFRGIDAVMNVLGPILAQHNLMIVPSVLETKVERVRTTGDKPANHWMVKVMYTFVASNAPDPSAGYATQFFGEAYDSSDKGLGKAITSAFKSMLFEVFCIPVEGQDDADSEQVEEVRNLTPQQVEALQALCKETKTKPAQFLKWLGYPTFEEVPDVDFAKALNALEQKRTLNQKKAEAAKTGETKTGDTTTTDQSGQQGEGHE